jgi:hypothetical protein
MRLPPRVIENETLRVVRCLITEDTEGSENEKAVEARCPSVE